MLCLAKYINKKATINLVRLQFSVDQENTFYLKNKRLYSNSKNTPLFRVALTEQNEPNDPTACSQSPVDPLYFNL